jgi:nucleoside-diphosphate-sugar epimerase
MRAPTVLLTGATGFIGGATLAELLDAHPGCRTLLLVRAENSNAAAERVRKSLGRFVDLTQVESGLRSCRAIAGDLTDRDALAESRLAAVVPLSTDRLDEIQPPPRLDDLTHVLHLASNTSFRSVRGVRHANILGTMTLAHRLRRVAGLERFLYVGTAYSCGDAGGRIVHEDDSPRYGARHVVEYTSSKAECEMLLENTAPELPLVVARPSIVIGHTRLGCLPSASLFWFYRTVDLLRRYSRPLETHEDVVPVDWVARALLFLLFKPALSHRRYHVSAGVESSVTWHEIAAVFARCYGERPENPFRIVDFATIEKERDRLRPLLGPGDEEHLLLALRLYFQFASLEAEIFDNSRLLQEGMEPPPKFTSHLALCALQPADRSVYEQMRDDE